MVSKLIILSLVVCVANAATWMGRTPKKPEKFGHKEGCYIEEIDDVVPFGEIVRPIGYCYEIYCGPTVMSYISCGTFNVPKNCHESPINSKLPYPACCPRIACDDENKIE